MKQLLQLQMTSRMDWASGSTASEIPSDGDAGFAGMLQLLLQTSSVEPMPAGPAPIPNYSVLTGAETGKTAGSVPSLLKPGLPPYQKSTPSAYNELIEEAGAKYGVATPLIKAVIDQESSFQADSVSSAGAKGLMQLMDGTARGLGVTDSFDPRQNIDGGTRFLASLLKKYNGNEGTALAAYNAGPGRIDRLGITNDAELRANFGSLPRETQHYVNRVLDLKGKYQV
ncbi:lytic transglycosylase domain-containing protein [Paenibacillus aurantius]|uniref:Lytic transglycosylase domain-containing protein n=1 Tax=Paenibacillus aurantius TaxID=2918900 RepID=A0AA96RHF1_9BACL|nr:lytic transglycosylase domain-containing protein [Paenibacillus aurantius]WNQ13481.1 lytic transglycosylase domain-containing protein [Paenibacillus aurantius]